MKKYIDYENFERDNTDVLFISKNSHINTYEELEADMRWYIDEKTRDFVIDDFYEDEMQYSGKDTVVIKKPIDKIKYAFACLHNDADVIAVLKWILGVGEVHVPNKRYTTKNYLKHWMEQYNFTLKDFIIDDKYIVFSNYWDAEKLLELGLIDIDAFEYISEDENWFDIED